MGHVTPSTDPELVDFAAQIVREAGALTLQMFKAAELAVERKGDGSPVTVADRQAERYLRERIRERFPDDEILGEEEPDQQGTSGRRWVIDPIDGTESFARGVALYTNLLYLEDEHGPAIGIINLPALGETVYAARGLGCFLDGSPVRVSDHPTLEGSHLSCTGFHEWTTDMFDRVQRAGVQLRTWGDAYGYALVASGRIEAMFDPVLAWWDIAALTVIVPESGGTLTRWDGSSEQPRADHELHSAIASNGRFHDQLVELLAP